jgi:hypothetical protein
MIKRIVELNPAFKFFTPSLQNQLFISASVTKCDTDAENAAGEIYNRIADWLSDSFIQIVRE